VATGKGGDRPYMRGILSEPLDLDGGGPRVKRPPARVEAKPGLRVTVRATRFTGVVVSCAKQLVTLRGADGRDQQVRLLDGAFAIDGKPVTLVPPRAAAAAPRRTASGSVAVPDAPARIARASRILVEGLHDAELVEKVWGDDLRVEGVVVEPLHGADDLQEVVRGFGPRPGRRLGILLDHLVDHSKESRIAAGIDHPDVLVTGHPFVDIWAAVKPKVVGIPAWPDVPKGQPWKEGVCAALGVDDTRRFWKQILASVTSYADLEPPLVGAVEQLIDFVTEPASA
jgi:hypothetical protein